VIGRKVDNRNSAGGRSEREKEGEKEIVLKK
jgi:hypothetical protein